MSMSLIQDGGEDESIVAINTTPLVDVMLVLLIIFLITIPVVTHTIQVNLPKENAQVRQTRPENINIAVAKNGDIYWNLQRVKNPADLTARLKEIATITPQPEIQIRGDADARYESFGRIVYACQRAGILRFGLITEPQARG